MSTTRGINDFSRLFRDLTRHNGRSFYCKLCLGHFTLESAFERHKQLCTREDFISTLHILSKPDSTIKFTNCKFMTWAPFVVYADLESILMPAQRFNTHLPKPQAMRRIGPFLFNCAGF